MKTQDLILLGAGYAAGRLSKRQAGPISGTGGRKPRYLKEAIDMGYIVKNIYARGSEKIRIDLEPRFYRQGASNVSFWVNRDYFARTYPRIYERLG